MLGPLSGAALTAVGSEDEINRARKRNADTGIREVSR